MFVRDVMTTNIITIPSSTSIAEARRIMEFHRLRRLPVVDKSKLVGIVSRDGLDRVGPSKLTTFSMHEISYLLGKITVKDVMVKNLFTVPPDATVEEAVAIAQEKQVGAVLVTENDRLVGIATTNDFFYKIANPVLGIGRSGDRIVVRRCGGAAEVAKVLQAVDRLGAEVVSMFSIPRPETGVQDLTLHLGEGDPSVVIEELKKLGYEVESRTR